jgi:RNA polymerase sigma-70 factor (ECF subfamily)
MINQSDKELLQDIALGNEQAFQMLFNRHWKSLFSFVYRLTRDEDHTKDILQDVFLYLWKNRENLYAGDSFLPYLNTVARSNVMSAFRKDKVRLQGVEVLSEAVKLSDSSDEQLLLKEVTQTVDVELSKMSFNMRQCFRLSRYEDKSIREIAVELKLSEQTVKNNISEALRRLRISMEQGSLIYLSVLVVNAVL